MPPPEGILQAVAEEAEIMILPELYVRLRLARSGLRIIGLYDPVPRHSVGLAYQSNRYHNIAAREFGTLCRTTMPRLLAHPKHSHRSTVTTG
jgi:DNA-binding transcriptional LysR family regulator